MCSLFAILYNNYSLKYRMLIVLINNNGQTLRRVLAPKSIKSSETTGSKDKFHAARRPRLDGDLRKGVQSAERNITTE